MKRLILLAAISTLVIPAMASASGPVGAGPRISQLGAGSWCFFASPTAIRVGGQTVTGYVDTSGGIVAVSLVHGVAAARYILHPRLQRDDHDNPTFYERTDGRVIAFYSRHAAGTIIYRITVRAGDITQWGPEMTVPDTEGAFGATYPNPVYIAAEHRLYLYFRGAGFHPTMAYSSDQGLTWSPASEVINPGTIASPGDGGPRPDRPYARYAARFNRTYVAFTNASPGSRPTNIYLIVRRRGGWFTVGGRRMTMPVAPAQALLVFDAARRRLRASVWDVQVDVRGRPVVAFITFRNLQPDAYWYARWTGRSWQVHRLTAHVGPSMSQTSSTYAPGLALDPADPGVVAVARMGHPIEIWRSRDGGKTWSRRALPGTENGVRPNFVTGDPDARHPELLYLAGRYHGYSDFQTRAYATSA